VKIAIVAAEAAPYAKAGGLADVIGALPGALKAAGEEPSLIVPGYASILDSVEAAPVLRDIPMRLGAGVERFSVLRAGDTHGVPMYLIDHPGFFGRRGIYGEQGKDYPDNIRRFVFFGRAAAVAAAEIVVPDVVHAHDWHSAALPIAMRADDALHPRFEKALSIFTIHNLAFQGIGTREDFALLNLDARYFSVDCLEFYAHLSLMKGAIVMCDGASTVSPAYAHEITTDPELGFGLEGVLRDKGENFVGILNGADYNEWDPRHDPLIPAPFSADDLSGKEACKRALLAEFGLPEAALGRPLIGIVSRFTRQKGADILAEAAAGIAAEDIYIAALGSGDPEYEAFFQQMAADHPERIAVRMGYDNELAHRIEAGADLFLMPSRYEPCGLNQMYSLRYGTVPVVRATGGLDDTIDKSTGFKFAEYSGQALLGAVLAAAEAFSNPTLWREMMRRGMQKDFSWKASAAGYSALYQRLAGGA